MGPAFNEQAGETLESSVVQAVSREEQGLWATETLKPVLKDPVGFSKKLWPPWL